MGFSSFAQNFGKNFSQWGVSASDAASRAQGYASAASDPSSGMYEGPRYVTQNTAPVRYASGGSGGGGLTTTARTAFGQAIDQFKPGGGYMKGIEAGLDRGRTKAVASGMSGLVSAGMSNTTQAGGLGKRYEEEIGAPTRAGAETQRMQNLASLYAALGGAEQGAYEGSAGRGLGYAQLNASTAAQQGQLGLGYAQVGASRDAAAGQLSLNRSALQLEYDKLNYQRNQNRFSIPGTAPSLY